jgi:hypothetical protein
MATIRLARLVSSNSFFVNIYCGVFVFFFFLQASMEPKEQQQQAQSLDAEKEALHGSMLMEIFGSLVVLETITLVIKVSASKKREKKKRKLTCNT